MPPQVALERPPALTNVAPARLPANGSSYSSQLRRNLLLLSPLRVMAQAMRRCPGELDLAAVPETPQALLTENHFQVKGPSFPEGPTDSRLQAPENYPGRWSPLSPASSQGPRNLIRAGSSREVLRLALVIRKYAGFYGVEENLVWAVIRRESGFDPGAVSPKGAMGLMQLMPDTAALMGVSDPYDVEQNIAGGIKFLEGCLARFNRDVSLALAAYNAGPENVVKYQGCPPFPETEHYVAAVLQDYSGEPRPLNLKSTFRNSPSRAETSSPSPRDSGLQWKVPAPQWKIAEPHVKVKAPQWRGKAPSS